MGSLVWPSIIFPEIVRGWQKATRERKIKNRNDMVNLKVFNKIKFMIRVRFKNVANCFSLWIKRSKIFYLFRSSTKENVKQFLNQGRKGTGKNQF